MATLLYHIKATAESNGKAAEGHVNSILPHLAAQRFVENLDASTAHARGGEVFECLVTHCASGRQYQCTVCCNVLPVYTGEIHHIAEAV